MASRSRVKRSKKQSAGKRVPAGRPRPRAQRKPQAKAKVAKARVKAEPGSGVIEAALAAFAHEVRTPLTGILAISDLLATSDLGERERRWVDTIKAGAEHLSALATLFVDAAKPGHARAALRDDLFDVRALARIAGDALAGRAVAKGLQPEVEIAEDLPSLVVGDPVRLRAALENLIDNAVKFTERGSVALKVSVARRSKDRIAIAFVVSDSGIGVSLKEIKRLFRPFSQANVSIAARFGGAGLGLSSVKQIARAMGGDVAVSQRGGGGTTFTLTVTLKSAQQPQATHAGEADGALPQGGHALRILSVEDNPFGRVVLNTILTELGHQAEFIGRGEDAIARVEQGAFDAVLMDMVLPGIDGIEAIRRIRRLAPPHGRIPIIGVSGRGEDEAASRAAGADAFLLKPVSPRALATALLEATRHGAGAT
ncbi:ATP-binding protein [Bradyrhizobium sp. ARR65]|uniref:ATP-binding protein n=1 Tax=Bradyrhizobium sp. ARR65 TaxID=1040989 RepID=UPI0004661803|nr:ATP-binding protein [Bradyrhizobium sp. ARR65]